MIDTGHGKVMKLNVTHSVGMRLRELKDGIYSMHVPE